MNLKQLVLKALKPKVSALGFNKKELEGVVAMIANNLSYADDASEEDIQSAINDKIDEVMPLLKIGQSQANRIVNERRAAETEEDDEDEKGDEDKSSKPKSKPKPKEEEVKPDEDTKPEKPKDEQPEWAKSLVKNFADLGEVVKALKGDLTAIKAKETSQTRAAKMQELLKDSGSYGSAILSMFPRISFNDDDEFNAYYDETKTNLETFNKEQQEKGLVVTPPAGGAEENKPKEITDEQIDAIAGMF